MKKETREELQKRIKKMEEERDDLRRQEKKFREEREEEDWELQKQCHALDEMRMQTGPEDRRLLKLIEESQNMINSIGREKAETADLFKENVRIKNLEWDMQEEDIADRIRLLQQEEKDKG